MKYTIFISKHALDKMEFYLHNNILHNVKKRNWHPRNIHTCSIFSMVQTYLFIFFNGTEQLHSVKVSNFNKWD
jgi:hypothetical protein